jgi:hypothetical protein
MYLSLDCVSILVFSFVDLTDVSSPVTVTDHSHAIVCHAK